MESWDPSPTGPARRIYTVNPAGREWAASASAALRAADDSMAAWEARYDLLRLRGGPQAVEAVLAAS